MEIEQDEPQHINKFLIPTRGAKANKYKLKGERLAEFLIRQDNNMGYYEPEEQPTYISVRNEVVSDFVESEDDC